MLWSVKCVLPHSVQADRRASFDFRFMETAGECVRLQHGYCTVTEAGQFTSHCLVSKT